MRAQHGAYAWAEDLDFPAILQTDYGPAVGPAVAAGASGARATRFSRRFKGGTVTLDCAAWMSSFAPH
jgi:hypothetical protein